MQHTLITAVVVALLAGGTATGAHAQSGSAPATKSAETKAAETKAGADKHRSEDIAKHRQMARAHEEAARCLESGEKEAVCQERLRTACSGIAVGRYCGMRHAH